MTPSISAGVFALNWWTALFKSASLIIYSGNRPSVPETAVTGGNLTLATFQFSTTPFAAATSANEVETASGTFVSNTVTPTNTGTATFARAYMFLVTSNGGGWTTGTAYTVGDIVTANNSYWVCVVAGTAGATAPTGGNILTFSDGGAVWAWIGSTTRGTAIADFSVSSDPTSGADMILSSTALNTTTNITCTQFSFTYG